MLYRETGQFKTSYIADQAIFPIRQDRYLFIGLLLVAFIAVPLLASEYWLSTIMLPFLVLALAAIGLNILTGYAGQLSLGTGGFMAVVTREFEPALTPDDIAWLAGLSNLPVVAKGVQRADDAVRAAAERCRKDAVRRPESAFALVGVDALSIDVGTDLYALLAPVASVAALVFAFLGLGPCQRASAARARLKAQGMDLGI